MRRAAVFLACLSVSLIAEARYHELGRRDGSSTARDPSRAYPLDDRPRELPEDVRRVRCDRSELVSYRGSTLRFNVPITIHPAFRPYVERFERLVADVSREHYGRAPRTLSHVGGYNCRTIRGERSTLSEHALGNAIDVRGFGFYRARDDQPLPAGIASHLRRSFVVRVEDHWTSDREVDAAHVIFFRKLRERLEAEPDLFQVMLGPSFPGHARHLHLDRAPFRFVQF